MRLGHALAVLAVVVVGCGAPRASLPPPAPPSVPRPLGDDARAAFDAAMTVFVQHDAANDWNDAACAAVDAMFDAAASAQRGPFPQAIYDAGLAWQRCGNEDRARARFEAAGKDFAPAEAKLALYRFRKDGDADAAIAALERAVTAGEFKNVAALVDLATMQMARGADRGSVGCKDDMDCARLNLQRALAIDDAYLPAMNQLALYYLKAAKKRVGGKAAKKRADMQQLELAALVCSQAMKKNAGYAPIHNTAGLVMNEMGQVNGAVEQFGIASRLDPKLFEAHMNLAAVNLSFRGFSQAEDAYRKALAVRPNDYDAHLGLALALRGPLTGAEDGYAQRIAAVQQEIEVAKKLDPERPDAWFNAGVLTQEFKARPGTPDKDALAALDEAEASFTRFIEKARGKSDYDGAVERAKGRLADIATARGFLKP